MSINLRKAHALVAALNTESSRIAVVASATITKFDNIVSAVPAAATKLDTAIKQTLAIYDTVAEIRTALGKANSEAGVDVIQTQLVSLEKQSKLYARIATADVRVRSLQSYSAEQEELGKPLGQYGATRDVLSIPLLDQDGMDGYAKVIRDLRKQEQDLKDALLAINVNKFITLSDKSVAVLKEYGLV